jgi:Domain of unknown function (DUF4164)
MIDGPAQRNAGPGIRTPATRETPGGSGESGRMGAPHAMPSDEPAAIDVASVEAATGRLIAALDALEAAAERRRDADRGVQSLAAQVQALGTDRSKLAEELDAEAVRRRQLEATNREIARRLDLAIEGIRSVLEAHDR